jgi:general secretion pathway protein J
MRTATHRGFTLAEILVASTISAFVAVVAVGALKTVSDGTATVTRHTEAVTEVRFAARMIARDLDNLYRDADVRSMRLVGASQGDDSPVSFLRFYMTGRTNARLGQPEGDVYEVEYFLGPSASIDGVAEDQINSSALYRRLWPNPDIDRQPGGILTPLSQNIDVFQVRFSDGREWTSSWPEEMQGLPELVEVTLVSLALGTARPLVESFTVNFPRLADAMDAASSLPGGAQNGVSGSDQGSRPNGPPGPGR